MRSGRSNTVRAIALTLALGANALFLLLMLFSHTLTVPEPAPRAMVWIVAELEPLPPPRRVVSPRTAAPVIPPTVISGEASASVAIEVPLETATGSSTAITAPPIDWYAAREKLLQDALRNGEPAPQQSSPESRIQVRPESYWIPPMKGTTQQLPGGGTRVWTSDLCYLDFNSLRLDPLRGGFSEAAVSVCKKRTMAERQSDARARSVEDAIKRKRSGAAPEPAPAAPVSGVQLP